VKDYYLTIGQRYPLHPKTLNIEIGSGSIYFHVGEFGITYIWRRELFKLVF